MTPCEPREKMVVVIGAIFQYSERRQRSPGRSKQKIRFSDVQACDVQRSHQILSALEKHPHASSSACLHDISDDEDAKGRRTRRIPGDLDVHAFVLVRGDVEVGTHGNQPRECQREMQEIRRNVPWRFARRSHVQRIDGRLRDFFSYSMQQPRDIIHIIGRYGQGRALGRHALKEPQCARAPRTADAHAFPYARFSFDSGSKPRGRG